MRQVRKVFSVMGLLLVASGAMMYVAGRAAQRGYHEIERRQRTITALGETLSTFKDAETGQRGYVLLGEESYLEPYQTARDHLDDRLRELDGLAADGDLAGSDVALLREAGARKLAELQRTIDLRRTQGIGAALDVVRSGDGRAAMDRLRDLVGRMSSSETKLLLAAQSEERLLARWRDVTFGVLLAVNLAFMSWVYGRVRRDAAAKAAAAAALERERRWLSTTLTSIGDAVIATDADAVITFINPTAERLTGWPRDDARGRPLAEVFRIVNENTRQTVESPVTKAIRHGVVVGLANHTLLISRDGREWPIDDSAAPIRGDGDRIVGVVMVFHDITERKAAERLLREADERFITFVQQVQDYAIFSTDAQGNFTTWNEGVRRILGYERDEFIGMNIVSLFTPEDIQAGVPAREMTQAAEHGSASDDRWLKRKNGSRFFASGMTTGVRDGEGGLVGFTKIFCDLTEQQRFAREREALLANEQASRMEAEAANRSKDVFLATLSHELRTPLNAIVGWVSILRGDSRTEADLKEGLEVIDRNTRAQSQLIEDVLDLSRIITGTMRLELAPADLPGVVLAAIQSVRPAAAAKQIEVSTDLDPSLDRLVCDAARMQQVVWNLLSNAVKFTGKGGAVLVSLSREKSTATIKVSDNGVGVTPEFTPFLFDRFRQADSSTRRKSGGLGLGLSIVKQLIELHGGSVEAHSDGPGKGATFIVRIPIAAVRPPDVEMQSHRSRIVAVDDEADARRVVAKVLTDAGAEVTEAPNVREALLAVERTNPHVLVSDIAMPDEDGHDLIREIRARGHTVRTLPAVALTAFAGKAHAQNAFLAGFQMHIAKPVDPFELLMVIATMTGRTGG